MQIEYIVVVFIFYMRPKKITFIMSGTTCSYYFCDAINLILKKVYGTEKAFYYLKFPKNINFIILNVFKLYQDTLVN